MAVLRLLASDGTGRAVQTWEIVGADVVVGRGEGTQIQLDHPSVSRRHARITRTSGGYAIASLSERNPVIVAGTARASHPLTSGDRVRLGQLELAFESEDPRHAATIYEVSALEAAAGPPAVVPAAAPPSAAVSSSAPVASAAPVPSRAPSPAVDPTPPPVPAPAIPSRPGAELVDAPRRWPWVVAIVAVVLVVGLVGGIAATGGFDEVLFDLALFRADRNEDAPDSPARDSGAAAGAEGGGELPSGEGGVAVAAKEVTAFEVGDDAKVQIAPGTFPTGTKVTMKEVPSSVVEGSRQTLVSAVFEIDAGGKQPGKPLQVDVKVDRSKIGKGETPLLARWENRKWIPYPTQAWDGGSTVSASIDHFSVTAVVVGLSAGGALYKAREMYNDGDFHTFKYGYVSPSGFRIYYNTDSALSGVRRGPGDDGEHPIYVVALGSALDKALRAYNGRKEFSSHDIDTSSLPKVLIHDLGYKKKEGGWDGLMGDTPPTGNTIWIHTNMPTPTMRVTAAHELFHIYQLGVMGARSMSRNLWWTEATAEWAASVVDPHDFFRIHPGEVAASHPYPALLGYGPQLKDDHAYMAGNLAIFIERQCKPGGALIGSLRGLKGKSASAWYGVMNKQAKRVCGKTLADLLGGYFVRYWWTKDDGVGDPAQLYISKKHSVFSVKDQAYKRWSLTVGPTKSEPLAFYNRPTGLGGTFVARARGEGKVNLFLSRFPLDGSAPAFPGGGGLLGLDLTATSTKWEGFGTKGQGVDGNMAYIVVSNPGAEPVEIEVEAYLILAPQGVKATKVEAKKRGDKDAVAVSWSPVKLPVVSGNDGALQGYRVYQRLGGREVLLAEVKAGITEVKLGLDKLQGKGDAFIVVRAVDKARHEGEASAAAKIERKRRLPPRPTGFIPLGDVPSGPVDPCATIFGMPSSDPKCIGR